MTDSNGNDSTDNNDKSDNNEENKLVQYMLINKELSKTIVLLKADNAKLRNRNKELNLENFTYQNEILKWKKKFGSLQTMHVRHVELLTGELQSYAEKLADVFGSDEIGENEDEVTRQDPERPSTSLNSASSSIDTSRRVSRSFESSKTVEKLQESAEENPSNLNTINEENEEMDETSNLEQISLVTSTYESTIHQDSNSTITNIDSNKENERPSTLMSSVQDEHSSTIRPNETTLKSVNKSPSNTPLKETYITQRRGLRMSRASQIESFENMNTAELVSSTPYKGKTTVRTTVHDSPMDIANTRRTRSGDSVVLATRTTMSISVGGRPKRKASPTNFAEPKLNTKLRRPRK